MRFCKKISDVAMPLTKLISKISKFAGVKDVMRSFKKSRTC